MKFLEKEVKNEDYSAVFQNRQGWNDAFKGNIQRFYRYIQEGMTGEATFAAIEQAVYVVTLTEAILESSRKMK